MQLKCNLKKFKNQLNGTVTFLRCVLLHFPFILKAHGGLKAQRKFRFPFLLKHVIVRPRLGIVFPPCLRGLLVHQISLQTLLRHLSGTSASQLVRRSWSPKLPRWETPPKKLRKYEDNPTAHLLRRRDDKPYPFDPSPLQTSRRIRTRLWESGPSASPARAPQPPSS